MLRLSYRKLFFHAGKLTLEDLQLVCTSGNVGSHNRCDLPSTWGGIDRLWVHSASRCAQGRGPTQTEIIVGSGLGDEGLRDGDGVYPRIALTGSGDAGFG